MATKDSRQAKATTTRKRKTTKAISDPAIAMPPTHEEIRTRAYFLYLQRNGSAGDPFEDWIRAEQELTASVHGA